MFVMVGIASHEFQRHRAYLGTVEHQFHMGRFGVLSAHLEAVGHSHREAHDVAFVAGIHALLHLGVGVRHHSSPVVPLSWYAAAPFPLLLPTSPNRASRAADRTQLKGSPVAARQLEEVNLDLDPAMMSGPISHSDDKGEEIGSASCRERVCQYG